MDRAATTNDVRRMEVSSRVAAVTGDEIPRRRGCPPLSCRAGWVDGLPDSRPQRMRRLEPHPRHDDLRQGDRRVRLAPAARHVPRGRRQPRRHRRRLHRRHLGGDHRPLAGPGRAGGPRPRRARHQGTVPDGRRRQRPRPLPATPAARPRRLAAPARRRRGRPLPGALLGPGHPARGDPRRPRRLRARGQGALRRAVQLHRLAGAEDRRARPRAPAHQPGHPPAAVQPAGPRARVGDRAVLPRRRPRAAALVAARRRLADREVQAGRAAHRRHPARREPRPRRRGLRPPVARSSAPGTSSTPCARSPTAAASRWRRSRWPGSRTGRPSPR